MSNKLTFEIKTTSPQHSLSAGNLKIESQPNGLTTARNVVAGALAEQDRSRELLRIIADAVRTAAE